MTILNIVTRWKFRNIRTRKWHKVENGCEYPRGGGYDSVKEMQKTLLKRFPDNERRRTRKITNGIVRIEGPWNNRQTQIITLEAN